MDLGGLLLGNRHFRLGRVVGIGTLVQTALWSVVGVALVTVYLNPTLLDSSLTTDKLLGAIPLALVPLVVVVAAVVVVVVRAVRELRYVVFGTRYDRHTGYVNDSDGIGDDVVDDLVDGVAGLGDGVDIGGFDFGDDE